MALVAARLALAGAAGLALGGGFFALLRVNVRLYASRRWPLGIALHLGRWALLAAALVVAARAGAGPLLAVLAGALVARVVLVRPGAEARP